VIHHDWWRDIGGLGGVPGGFGFVDAGGGKRFVFSPFGVLPDTFIPPDTVEGDQSFFAFSSCRTWNTSCTMLLLFKGLRAISSEAAATTIQKTG